MTTALALLALIVVFAVGAVIVSKVPDPGQPHNLAVKIGRVYFPLVFVGLVLSMIASNLQGSGIVTGVSLGLLILSIVATEVVWFQPRNKFPRPYNRV
ncbi:hypothetical protein KC949_02565 [Candidatus Saccharibacteria bacterium]|jgi:hypothetical protein|nr:hypothetical protein [Candidatus Saccharibacteria bacterium]